MERMPHIVFEEDLIAHTIVTSYTAEVKTQREKDFRAWVDHSNGSGEFETNDPAYAYLYIVMPKTVDELAAISRKELRYRNAEYEKFYHPSLTKNNWSRFLMLTNKIIPNCHFSTELCPILL